MPARLVLAVLLAALLLVPTAALAAADPPNAATLIAKDVGQTQATLTATVNPHGAATSVYFDLGTSTDYGVQSAPKDAGAGTEALTVEIPVQGLTAHTTYHFRVVATSPNGTVRGADQTFTTASPPAPAAKPTLAGVGSRDTSRTGTTLVGSVNPKGTATSYHFEYGTSSAYGAVAGQGNAGSGSAAVAVKARIEGLVSGTRYHYRLVATSAAGTTASGDHTVTTKAAPTTATLARPAPVVYARPATVTGTLKGPSVSGVVVRLQGAPFPFTAPFGDLATTKSTSKGAFSFTLPALLQSFQLRVVTDGNPAAVSGVVLLKSAARVGILHVHRHRRSVGLVGRLAPATGQGTISVQRQTASGGWTPLRRTAVGADGRFAVSIARRVTKAITIRVVGIPNDGGAHARGYSRTLVVPAILRRR